MDALRWAGNKRSMAAVITPLLNARRDRTYVEPFFGSGGVGRALLSSGQIDRSVPHFFSDSSEPLVKFWEQVITAPNRVNEELTALCAIEYDKEAYLELRSTFNRSFSAARMIMLNRMSFNGLWRVNKRGEFNVPFDATKGRVPSAPLRDAVIMASNEMKGQTVSRLDAMSTLGLTSDLKASVYCDPPYRQSFGAYTPDDNTGLHACLNDTAVMLAQSGCRVVIHDAYEQGVSEQVYRGADSLVRIVASARIAPVVASRGTRQEVLAVYGE